MSAPVVSEILKDALPRVMGSAFDDVEHIRATNDHQIEVVLRRASPFLVEALEVQVGKPGSPQIGTGPFVPFRAGESTEMRANPNYYLGRPSIDRVHITGYPSVRTAWAEMLRGHLDMLYEVGADALESLEGATNVALFTFVRHYQYQIAFNVQSPNLRSPQVRRALNLAIDRRQVVSKALDGHGLESTGPIWPMHWAYDAGLPRFEFEPQQAAAILADNQNKDENRLAHVRFTCLVPPDPAYERIALVVKRQLESVGADMSLQEVSQDQILEAVNKRDFDAVLFDPIGGASLFKLYLWWHSGTSRNLAGIGSPGLDRALDTIRYARTDDEYRRGVSEVQRETIENPPAIFLAWSERARAVSRRFVVPSEPGHDVLTMLRLWKPADAEPLASRN